MNILYGFIKTENLHHIDFLDVKEKISPFISLVLNKDNFCVMRLEQAILMV